MHFERISYSRNQNETQNPVIIDITYLLEAAPQLKELKLFDCAVVLSSWPNTDLVETMKNTPLTKLKILTQETNTSTLKYIVTLLKDVKFLHLAIGYITADENISENEAETMLDNLRACAAEMEKVRINYLYNNEEFLLEFDNISQYYGYSNALFGDDDDDDIDYVEDSDYSDGDSDEDSDEDIDEDNHN
ncbi:hypothetical protein EDC94DRAFT_47638 [Helicostylum pulchrum]|nr:hypothetical protein EDC94DRAFT_47638 [Helicostylum pulchrum]